MSDTDELAALKRKLAARQGIPAFKSNCEDIRKRIAELEAERAA